jgi:hypothetical protein
MNVPERVAQFLKTAAFCDDCIADRVGISPRQQAQHATSALSSAGAGFTRFDGTCVICKRSKKVIRAN